MPGHMYPAAHGWQLDVDTVLPTGWTYGANPVGEEYVWAVLTPVVTSMWYTLVRLMVVPKIKNVSSADRTM